MSDDRLAHVRAEAWKRYPEGWDPYNEEAVDDWGYSACQRLAFQRGVEWADANQHSTPEDLVAAYEEGQRDAVSKGMASPQPRTITRAEFLEALDAHVGLGASGDWVTVEDMLIAAFMAAGIEVRDE